MDEIESLSRGERTRAAIIQSALNLFGEYGYHGTSMRQIAQRAGVALGGIYNHFDSKEQIFLTVLTEAHPLYYLMPVLSAAQGDTIEEFAHEAARLFVAGVEERLDFIKLLFIELVEFKGQHLPQMFTVFFPGIMELAGRFAQSQPELRPIPPFVLVRAFIGLLFSHVMIEFLVARHLPPDMEENTLEHVVEIFLHGSLVENPPAAE